MVPGLLPFLGCPIQFPLIDGAALPSFSSHAGVALVSDWLSTVWGCAVFWHLDSYLEVAFPDSVSLSVALLTPLLVDSVVLPIITCLGLSPLESLLEIIDVPFFSDDDTAAALASVTTSHSFMVSSWSHQHWLSLPFFNGILEVVVCPTTLLDPSSPAPSPVKSSWLLFGVSCFASL